MHGEREEIYKIFLANLLSLLHYIVVPNQPHPFHIAKAQWKKLADRVESLCYGQQLLFSLEAALEKEAQRIAKIVTRKFSTIQDEQSTIKSVAKPTDYQTVDVNSLVHDDIRKIGAEHVGYHAACQLNLETLLTGESEVYTQN